MAYLSLDSMRDGGRKFLESEMRTLRERSGGNLGVEVTTHLAVGHVGMQLVELAEDGEGGPADLVVLGSRGVGGFRGLLLGSATTYAVHHLSCPLWSCPKFGLPGDR